MEAANLAGRHVCKLCYKSFSCGRSLGGHMRSHLTNTLAENDERKSRRSKTKLQFANYSSGSITNMEEAEHEEIDLEAANLNLSGFGYGLRKNPKKTQKLEFLSGESSLQDKFCRECGKGFQSWKALFGHMKCHSERLASTSLEMEEPDSHITDSKQKLVMDIQSDNETEAPNKRKRSQRRVVRYNNMGSATANSASFSFVTDSSYSASEIEQEQEVAISLMMLSRDHMGNWVGFDSPSESSDNSSKFLEAPSFVESKASVSISNGSELMKSRKLKGKSKLNKFDGLNYDQILKIEVKQSEFSSSKMIKKSGSKSFLKKTDSNPTEFSSDISMRRKMADFLDSKISKKPKKRSKFECDICNKIFLSYQALGGHRASHKKQKGCFASKMEISESNEEIDFSAKPKAESKLSKSFNNGFKSDQEMGYGGNGEKAETSSRNKKNNKHKCPICQKVFASGQALGGHKRSHLISNSEAKNSKRSEIEEQEVPEMREFLDLNLPAPPDERESKDHMASLKPWWVGNEHKHEPLVGFNI